MGRRTSSISLTKPLADDNIRFASNLQIHREAMHERVLHETTENSARLFRQAHGRTLIYVRDRECFGSVRHQRERYLSQSGRARTERKTPQDEQSGRPEDLLSILGQRGLSRPDTLVVYQVRKDVAYFARSEPYPRAELKRRRRLYYFKRRDRNLRIMQKVLPIKGGEAK